VCENLENYSATPLLSFRETANVFYDLVFIVGSRKRI